MNIRNPARKRNGLSMGRGGRGPAAAKVFEGVEEPRGCGETLGFCGERLFRYKVGGAGIDEGQRSSDGTLAEGATNMGGEVHLSPPACIMAEEDAGSFPQRSIAPLTLKVE